MLNIKAYIAAGLTVAEYVAAIEADDEARRISILCDIFAATMPRTVALAREGNPAAIASLTTRYDRLAADRAAARR